MSDIKELTKENKEAPFSNDLIKALEYTSKFTSSIAMFHLIDLKIADLLIENNLSSKMISEELNLDEEKLFEFLLYCVNENFLTKERENFTLSSLGKTLYKCKGWFELLVGGYGETYFQIGDVLTKKQEYASRNTKHVGVGSCNMSKYDALPLTKKLMNLDEDKEYLILDLGCGNGLYLSYFCKELPNIRAVGVEPSIDGFEEAIQEVNKSGLSDRIQLFNADSIKFFEEYSGPDPDYIVFAFVLHEILGQNGYSGLFQFLQKIRDNFPKSKVIVVEVDNVLDNHDVMKDGIENGYYNPYYLIHTLTEQKLESRDFWRQLFLKIGFKIENEITVDHDVDASDLEIGFLLS